MKAILNVAPCEYKAGMVSVAFPYKALAYEVIEVRNAGELAAKLESVRAAINADAQIYLKPLGRKFAGYDNFKRGNPRLFSIEKREV